MSKYAFNEEKLYWEIKAAKEKYKEIYWKVTKVHHHDYRLEITLKSKKEDKEECKYIPVNCFKCLEGKSIWDIKEVSLLGERAIQWEKLDIQIGLDNLLLSVQFYDEWLESLK